MLFWVLTIALSLSAMAQEMPLTVRNGNTYVVGNQVMNRYAYGTYLNEKCPQAAVQFNSGMNLSRVGWGLFAGGLALNTVAVSMGLAHPVKDEVLPYHHAMDAMYYTGNAMLTASIPVLIVGYVKQHNAANTYNSLAGSQAYVSLNMSGNGFGIAYNF